jgi:hypothetical protein
MIDMMGPEKLGRWMIVLAIVFATMIFVSHKVMRRARRDPANRVWFEQYSPASLRDFLPQIAVITAIVLFGSWLWRSGNYGWTALCALIAAHGILGYEIYKAANFWNQSMGGGETD